MRDAELATVLKSGRLKPQYDGSYSRSSGSPFFAFFEFSHDPDLEQPPHLNHCNTQAGSMIMDPL